MEVNNGNKSDSMEKIKLKKSNPKVMNLLLWTDIVLML